MRVPVYLKQEQVRCGTITEHELAAQSGTFAVSAFRVRGALHRARASEKQATHHGPRFVSIPLQSGALGIRACRCRLPCVPFPVIAVPECGPPLRCADENLFFFPSLRAGRRGSLEFQ
jgi:hypothetical protein